MSDVEYNFPSWAVAADVFDEAATGAPGALSQVVAATTDPNACGAGTGYSSVDAAMAVALGVFAEVMEGTVSDRLRRGLASEATALADAGTLLRQTEDLNAEHATSIQEWL